MNPYPNYYLQQSPSLPLPSSLPLPPLPLHPLPPSQSAPYPPALGIQYVYNDDLRKETQHKQIMERYKNRINSYSEQHISSNLQQKSAAQSYEQAMSELKNSINKEVSLILEIKWGDFANTRIKQIEEHIETKYQKLFNDFLSNFSKEPMELESQQALENLSREIQSLKNKNISNTDISGVFVTIKEISKKIKNEELMKKLNEETINLLNFTINMYKNPEYLEKLNSDVMELQKQSTKNSTSLQRIIDGWGEYNKTLSQRNYEDLSILSKKQEETEMRIRNLEEKMNNFNNNTNCKKKQKQENRKNPMKFIDSARNKLFEIIKRRYNFQMGGEGRKFRSQIYCNAPLPKFKKLFEIFKQSVIEIMNEWENIYNLDNFLKETLLKWIAMKNIVMFLIMKRHNGINEDEWLSIKLKIKQFETRPLEVLSYVLNPFFDSLLLHEKNLSKLEVMILALDYLKKENGIKKLINMDWVKSEKTINSEKFRQLTKDSNMKIINSLNNNFNQKDEQIPEKWTPLLKQKTKEEILIKNEEKIEY